MLSIKQFSNETINELEQYIQKKKSSILPEIYEKLACFGEDDHSLSEYDNQDLFEFLPGHRTILLSLKSNIQRMQKQAVARAYNNAANNSVEIESGKYPFILTEFIKTANQTFNKSKHAHQYNDVVKYFSTYIFLLCGRTCYETLNKNLPIPSTKTICKF